MLLVQQGLLVPADTEEVSERADTGSAVTPLLPRGFPEEVSQAGAVDMPGVRLGVQRAAACIEVEPDTVRAVDMGWVLQGEPHRQQEGLLPGGRPFPQTERFPLAVD